MSERLSAVPTPPAQLWRQIRLQYVPVIVFLVGVFAAAFLWIRWVAPPTLIGEAEATRAEVRSALPGMLAGLDVAVLQSVTAGQKIGEIIINDPRVLATSLATIRAEIASMRATLDPVVGLQRAAFDFLRLQLELMTKRVELATLQGELQQAEATLARSTGLHRSKLITDEEYERARSGRDTLVAQIKALNELIADMEPRVRKMETAGHGQDTSEQALRVAIEHKEAELRQIEAELGPRPLTAPIDGIVTMVYRRAGEAVGTAEPILQITASQSNRIIGYLRQPLPLTPRPGASVELRTRTLRRQIANAKVEQVGRQFEPIPATLLAAMRLPVSAAPTEFGLRVHVTMPAGFTIRPGEHVDVIILDE